MVNLARGPVVVIKSTTVSREFLFKPVVGLRVGYKLDSGDTV